MRASPHCICHSSGACNDSAPVPAGTTVYSYENPTQTWRLNWTLIDDGDCTVELLHLFIVSLSRLTRPPHQRSSSTCRLALVRGGRSASTTTRTWWERTSCGAPSAGVLACPHAVIAHYTNLALTGVCLRSGPGVVVDRKATAHETPGSDAVQNVELVSAESTCTAPARAHIVKCRGLLATHFLSRMVKV